MARGVGGVVGAMVVAMVVATVDIGTGLAGVRGVDGRGSVHQSRRGGNAFFVSLAFHNVGPILTHQSLNQTRDCHLSTVLTP